MLVQSVRFKLHLGKHRTSGIDPARVAGCLAQRAWHDPFRGRPRERESEPFSRLGRVSGWRCARCTHREEHYTRLVVNALTPLALELSVDIAFPI
jgi:hypothetical protein